MNKRILLFGDSRWRDSFGLALVKHTIGDGAEVVSYDFYERAITSLKPHVVVLNHLMGERNTRIARMVWGYGGKVAVLPTEGRPNTPALTEWFISSNQDADLFLAWNDRVRTRNNSVVTGCPRFQIYTTHKHLIEPRETFRDKHRIPRDADMVSVMSSFPQAKFRYMMSEFNRRDWRDLGITSIDGRENPDEFAEYEYQQLMKFRQSILGIMAVSGSVFAVKAHPMEDVNTWMRFCDEFELRFVPQAYSHDMISASDAVYARIGCMTVIEASLVGVPVEKFGGAEKETYTSLDPEQLFGGIGDPADAVAGSLMELADKASAPKMSKTDYLNFRRLLSEGAAATYPRFGQPHLGKAVVEPVINEWVRKIGGQQ